MTPPASAACRKTVQVLLSRLAQIPMARFWTWAAGTERVGCGRWNSGFGDPPGQELDLSAIMLAVAREKLGGQWSCGGDAEAPALCRSGLRCSLCNDSSTTILTRSRRRRSFPCA